MNVSDVSVKVINIINPAAGKGAGKITPPEGEIYWTKGPGDAEVYINELCRTSAVPLHLYIWGGDGTLSEAVNGVMSSGRADNVKLSVVPIGTGNDFVRAFEKGSGEHIVDVMKVNGRYAVNAANTGFDCQAVVHTSEMKKKPLISGSLAYGLGVAQTLLGKLGEDMTVSYTDENGNTDTVSGSMMLCVVSNAPYYGGGFKPGALAKYDDGLLDMMIVPKITRLQFISLVGDYKAGRHLDPETGTVAEKFKKIIRYHRIKSVKIEGISYKCLDGEVTPDSEMNVEVVTKALKFVF